MAEVLTRRVDVSTATFLRLLGVAAFVWAWWHLWHWILIFFVAVFLAIALDPLVKWIDRRGLKRRFAGPLVVLVLALVVGGFLYFSGSSLKEQVSVLGQRITEAREQITGWIPEELKGLITTGTAGGSGSSAQSGEAQSSGGGIVMRVVRAVVSGVTSILVVLVLTAYLLIDGRRTYEWFVAFAPPARRARVNQTAQEAHKAVIGYMRGSITTSALTAVITFIVLASLKVPAPLLLAMVAGILNFVPVVGLMLSLVPAVLLALTVSPGVAIAVVGFYLLYNAIENYYIQPKVYGHEMQLSSLAVLAAFAAGAELGGVLGALTPLPIAAMYPPVESLWLKGRPLHPASVEDHRQIERTDEH